MLSNFIPQEKIPYHKINAYIELALVKYLQEKLSAIKNECEKLKISSDQANTLQNLFIDKLLNIHFIEKYTEKKFTTDYNGFEIDYESFVKFIHRTQPSLEKIDVFISNAFDLPEKKRNLLQKISLFQETINEYHSENKKNLVEDFNKSMAKLEQPLKNKNFLEAREDVKKLSEFLNNIQTEESRYYTRLNFFSPTRQINSTLQPKIDSARKIYESIKEDYKTLKL